MSHVSIFFQSLVSIAAVSMIVLAVGAIITRQLRQPIERVRCIQTTFAALMVALFARQASILPPLSLSVLPPKSVAASLLVHSTSDAKSAAHASSEAANPSRFTNRSAMHRPLPEAPVIATSESADVSPHAAAPHTRIVPEPFFSSPDAWTAIQLSFLFAAAAGGLYFVGQLSVGHLQLQHLRRNSESACESLLSTWREYPEARSYGTRVLVSRIATVPLTFGVRRPVIILPQTMFESMDSPSVACCLSHELAHIRSRDNVTWCIVQWMQPILWFQPLFWLMRRKLRMAQDQLADDYAAGRAADRTVYADLLMGMVRGRIQLGGGLALSHGRSTFQPVSPHRAVAIGPVPLGSSRSSACNTGYNHLLRAGGRQPGDVASGTGHGQSYRRRNTPFPGRANVGNEKEGANPAVAKANEDAVELSYSGEVIDKETKQPIPNATIVVRRSILLSYERKIIEESRHKTDKNGVYQFTIPPEQTAERGLYIELDVEHPDYAWKKGFGYALSMIRKNEQLGERPFFSKIELNPAEVLTGRIVNPQGEPLADVNIQAYSKTSADDWEDYGSFFQTKSDQDGRFHLQLVKGGPSVFWVVPRDYCPLQIVSATKRGEWGDIAVEQGIAITGKVISATGEPVDGVWVNLEDQEVRQQLRLPVATYVNRSAKTLDDGTFTLRPMKAGKYRLDVRNYGSELTGEKRSWSRPKQLDDVFVARQIDIGPQDAGRPFTIQASPHVEFHAQYLNSAGEATTGHDVMLFGQLDGQSFYTRFDPDKDGKIVGKLPHGLTDVRMNAITNEHGAVQVRLKKDGPLHSGSELKLGTIEDDITGIEIIRYRAPIVQLKPVDENGDIVTDCKVAGIYSDGRDETMQPVGGMATNILFEHQEDGRHRTSQMIPNRKVIFTATAEGFAESSETVELPEGAEQEVVLVLKKATPSSAAKADENGQSPDTSANADSK